MVPQVHYNIDLNFDCIESVDGFTNFFSTYFSAEEMSYLNDNFANILSSIINFYPYEFYDIISKTYKTRLFFIDSNYNLLEYTNSNFININSIKFSQQPNILLKDNKIYFYDEDFMCYIECDNNLVISSVSASITSFVCSGEELFFIDARDKFNIYYTQKDYLENLQNNLLMFSKISVCPTYGEILKIVNIKNKIYVFQKYKISYIYTNSNNHYLIDVIKINHTIYPNTISANESYIYYSSSNGLFIFDGNETKNIHSLLFNTINTSFEDSGTFFNGYYYLKTSKIENDKKYDLVLRLNENTNPIIYKTSDITSIKTIKSNSIYALVLLKNNGEILYFDNSSTISNEKYIKFNKITFNSYFLKNISSLKIFNKGKFTLIINSDLQKATYEIENNFSIDNINIPGHIFEFEIKSNNNFKIENIFVELNVIEDSND